MNKKLDAEAIRMCIEKHYQVAFDNLGETDELFEGPCDHDEKAYDLANKLLTQLELVVRWK